MASICVIGAGIIGLTTARLLSDSGHKVTILYSGKRRPTSPTAAAFFYPFAVAGGEAVERKLALPTLDFLFELARTENTGVRILESREYFDEEVNLDEMHPRWWMKERKSQLAFRKLRKRELPRDVNGSIGAIASGWTLQLPVVDMPILLKWLRFTSAATFLEADVESIEQVREDIGEFDVFVNCTGIWATHIVSDPTLVGVKGVVVKTPVALCSQKLIFLEKGRCETRPVYIVPHKYHAVLGGTLERILGPGDRLPEAGGLAWTATLSDALRVLKRCQAVLPELREWNPSDEELLACSEAAPRPVRETRPRVEISEDHQAGRLIHNYGHGGSGLTMCWGSAESVLELIPKLGVTGASTLANR